MMVHVRSLTILFALAGALLVPDLAQAQQSTWQRIRENKVLRIGAAQAEPWYFKDTTNSTAEGGVTSGNVTWRGVGPTVGKAIADAMQVKLEIVETTYGNAVAALQANQFDVMFVLDGTPRRAMAVDFLSVPLLWFPMGFYSNDAEMSSAITWKELNDPKYKVGVFLGGNSDQFATRHIPKSTISRFQQEAELWAAFQSGRINGVVVPTTQLTIMKSRLKIGKVVNPKPFAAIPAGVAIPRETDANWRNFLTTSVLYMYNSGEIERLYETYLAFRGVDPKDALPVIREQW